MLTKQHLNILHVIFIHFLRHCGCIMLYHSSWSSAGGISWLERSTTLPIQAEGSTCSTGLWSTSSTKLYSTSLGDTNSANSALGSWWELMWICFQMFSVYFLLGVFFFFSDFSLGCPLRFNLHKCCGTLAQDDFEGEQNSSYEFLSARDEGHPLALTHC